MVITQNQAEKLAADYTAAWNTGSPEAVASFYAKDGVIVINRGDPWNNRAGVAEMASGFFADIPDLNLVCDAVRAAGDHVTYQWTFTGTHTASGNKVRVLGWEEWDINYAGEVQRSLGWFDSDEYSRQTDAE